MKNNVFTGLCARTLGTVQCKNVSLLSIVRFTCVEISSDWIIQLYSGDAPLRIKPFKVSICGIDSHMIEFSFNKHGVLGFIDRIVLVDYDTDHVHMQVYANGKLELETFGHKDWMPAPFIGERHGVSFVKL